MFRRALLVVALTAAGLVALTQLPSSGPSPASQVVAVQWVGAPEQPEAAERDEPGEDAGTLQTFWNDRLTYPSGHYNPAWLRRAAHQDDRVGRNVPAGEHGTPPAGTSSLRSKSARATTLLTNSFVALGPKPERMTGCVGCFDYATTAGRINAIVVDPTTTTNGSIVAYSASDGGGVWKTTNCCTSGTTWAAVTDDPQIATISIDTLAIDPSNHNTIYAGTGDLNFGSFSMGSQGILKSTNAGATWSTLGDTVFGPAYAEPAGQFPQYDSVGKVRVDPNNSAKVVAGTKKGLFFSYNGGTSWTGPCLTNSFPTQRQDITALELSNMGGGVTRIIAAIGARGFNSPVQFDLDQNGANGIYRATMGASGCPAFTSIATNANGFVYGTATTSYPAGTSMNAASGAKYVSAASGNQLGRIDIGVAPSDANTIYAQVQSITPNVNSGGSSGGCASANGCQLGAWMSTNGGTSWTFMNGSSGMSLQTCANTGAGSQALTGDYPQNWYDQGVAVDPNNPNRVYFDTYEIWLVTVAGGTPSAWYNASCGYQGSNPHPVHVDQHALAFVPGSSSMLLAGNDGGVHGTANANAAALNTLRPTWFNMDTGFNTIEFYDGDLGPSFATSAAPTAAGGAQDNMNSFVTFAGGPTGPAQWQGNIGGDGFYAAIDGKGGFFYASNNSGQIHRCSANCTQPSTGAAPLASWSGDIRATAVRSDRQSFAMPFELFRGKPTGAGNGECGARCNHMLVGTFRAWETPASDGATITWTARTPDLTKGTLGNRSYINQLHYAPADQTLGIVGTNDGNVEFLTGLGGANGVGANVLNVTGGNAVLPNRPILDVAIDPTSTNTAANPLIGYAAVGGFNVNTPSTAGHVFRVVCDVNCTSPTWTDKSGNLPDIPADSIVANPNVPQQVFVGTDFGLYFTNDISAASPKWYRFANGLSNAMVWSLTIDRGNTTLGVWTRSRGAYAWPLPTAAIKQDQTLTFGALAPKQFGDADFDLVATASSGLPVSFAATGDCTVVGATAHITGAGNCSVTASQSGNIDYAPAADVTRAFAIAKAGQTITFAPIAAKTFGDADFDPAATSTSGLAVAYSAVGTCSIVGGLVHIAGAGPCTVTASQGGNANYEPATAVDQAFTIAKATQTINFGTTEDKSFGDADFEITATATSGLAVVLAVVSGPCTLSSTSSPANVHIGGAGTCNIQASQGGNDDYQPAPDEERSFAINKANQTIDFAAISDRTFGDADFDLSATATSSLAVSFAATGDCTVTGSSLHITGAGSCTVTASQAGNGDYNPAPDVGRTFAIDRASQSIDFAPLPDRTYGDADFGVSATATSALGVQFSATGDCTSTDSTIHIDAAGTCTVTASQPGNANYKPAADVARSFAIQKAGQTIAFPSIGDKTYGDPDFYVVASASSGLTVAFSATGNCAFVYGKLSITGAGSCTVTASQEGDHNYEAAPDVARTFAIGRADQSINFSAIDDATFGTADFEVDATASSGLTVTLGVVSGPCTLNSTLAPATVHISGSGACVIRASQAGNANYKPAPNETRSFSIAKAHQSIAFNALADKTFGDPDFAVHATASSGLLVEFAASGECTVSGTNVHIKGAGSCTITASQAGNANYNPAPDVSRSFAIGKAPQTIAFAALPLKTFGDPPFPVAATASSGLSVSFSAVGNCTVIGNVVTLTGVAPCTITASQPGNADYQQAPDVSRTFAVYWPFNGFFPPISNGVFNVANAGSSIPVKFSLGGDRGLAIFAGGAPQVTQISCSTSAGESGVTDASAPGNSGLVYSNGQYHYVWKTDKAWAGTCRQLNLKLVDGSDRIATFSFR
jgi:hypothetical protein